LRALKITHSLIRHGKLVCRIKNVIVLPKALWLARVATEWGADHIHAHWAGCTASMAWAASRFSGIPWSFTAHRWDILENNSFEAKAGDASFVRFISLDGEKICASLGISIPKNKIKVLHLGVQLPSEGIKPVQTRSRLVGLCPAHLIRRKGQRYLIDALRIVTDRGLDVAIWLAGQGEDLALLQEQARVLGIEDRVRFLGQVAHGDLLRMYQESSCDFVVLPSLHEGIPASLMEAMSYGIPVIATASGGTSELVDRAGLLVRPSDSFDLADAITQLCREPRSINLFADLGRKRVESEFSVKAIASEIVKTMALGQNDDQYQCK
jgi:glycosyltransferase involved in cell wall biosynthesis